MRSTGTAYGPGTRETIGVGGASAPAGVRRRNGENPVIARRIPSLVFALAAPLCLIAVPASAASLTSVSFVVAATPALAFADAASRLARTRSDNANIRRFARRDEEVETEAAEDFVKWGLAERARAVAAVETRSLDMLGPIFGLSTLLGLGSSYDVSVAVLPPRLRSDTAESKALLRLEKLSGAAFDAIYAPTQVEALERLSAVYTGFIKNGDDVDLRALAVRQLPKVRALLAQARHL